MHIIIIMMMKIPVLCLPRPTLCCVIVADSVVVFFVVGGVIHDLAAVIQGHKCTGDVSVELITDDAVEHAHGLCYN